MLERLKIALGIKTDTELARHLGIPQPTLANQKSRGNFDFQLIFQKAKSDGINLHWLYTGEGEMYANNAAGKALQAKNSPQTFDENTIASSPIAGIPSTTLGTILPDQLSEIENDIKQVLLKIQSLMK